MKLLRYEQAGTVRLGVLDGDAIAPLEGLAGAYTTMRAVAAGGADALERVARFVSSMRARTPLSAVRLLAPIERPGKYRAIGMNYRKHAAEAAKRGGPDWGYREPRSSLTARTCSGATSTGWAWA